MFDFFTSIIDDILTYYTFFRNKEGSLCEDVLVVRKKKKISCFGKHALIASHVKKSIGEIGCSKTKRVTPNTGKTDGFHLNLESAPIVRCCLSERKDPIAQPNAHSLIGSSKTIVGAGNGLEKPMSMDMVISRITTSSQECEPIDIATKNIVVQYLMVFMFAILVTIGDVVRQTIFFLGLTRTTCQIVKERVERLKGLRLLEGAKVTATPFLTIRSFLKLDLFMKRDLKIVSLLKDLTYRFIGSIQLEIEILGSIYKPPLKRWV